MSVAPLPRLRSRPQRGAGTWPSSTGPRCRLVNLAGGGLGSLLPPQSLSLHLFSSMKDFLPKEYIKQKGERKIFMVSGGQGGGHPGTDRGALLWSPQAARPLPPSAVHGVCVFHVLLLCHLRCRVCAPKEVKCVCEALAHHVQVPVRDLGLHVKSLPGTGAGPRGWGLGKGRQGE